MNRKNKILILGSFAEGALERQYVRGLASEDWQIYTFEIQKPINERRDNTLNKILFKINSAAFLKEINEQILTTAKELSPTVILVFKGMQIFPETIRELKRYCVILCNYNADHPYQFFSEGSGNANVKNSIKYYDIYFTYSRAICEKLNVEYNVLTECVPFAFDETIRPQLFSNESINKDFIFVGAWDSEREKQLSFLGSLPLKVFGPDPWLKKTYWNRNLKKAVRGFSLYGNKYANACSSAMGVINLLRQQNLVEQSHNMRTFEVPGYGGLLLTQRTKEQLEFFEEDKEAIFFNCLEELRDKILFLTTRASLVKSIKLKALERANSSNYSYSARASQLSNMVKKLL